MNYLNINSIDNLSNWVKGILDLKSAPYMPDVGRGKTLGMLFFNPSLRTRMSTQKAAQNLGMHTIVMNIDKEGWLLEFEDGIKMNQNRSEHVKEAARVISQYCDVIAIRAFAGLNDKVLDESEPIIRSFEKYATVPILNMESATAHPLQALADIVTIEETKTTQRPKVVLSWTPHPKALPHAVANSFIRFMQQSEVDIVITHPKGYELHPSVVRETPVLYSQEEALANAEYVYAKNWSAYQDYGKILPTESDWKIDMQKLSLGKSARFMHCLPVRRNVIVTDEVLESTSSLVVSQANNRTYATQYVLKKLLKNVR